MKADALKSMEGNLELTILSKWELNKWDLWSLQPSYPGDRSLEKRNVERGFRVEPWKSFVLIWGGSESRSKLSSYVINLRHCHSPRNDSEQPIVATTKKKVLTDVMVRSKSTVTIALATLAPVAYRSHV